LFVAIKSCLILQENRIPLKKLHRLALEKKKSVSKENLSSIKMNYIFDTKDLFNVFKKIFIEEDYKVAFTYPFDKYNNTKKGDGSKIKRKYIASLKTDKLNIEENKKEILIKSKYSNEQIYLNDFHIDFSPQRFSYNDLNILALMQLRNIAAHSSVNFSDMRRYAIATWSLFIDSMINELNQDYLMNEGINNYDIPDSLVKKDREYNLQHPLCRRYHSDQENVINCIKEVLSALCFYGRNKKMYENIYRIVKT